MQKKNKPQDDALKKNIAALPDGEYTSDGGSFKEYNPDKTPPPNKVSGVTSLK